MTPRDAEAAIHPEPAREYANERHAQAEETEQNLSVRRGCDARFENERTITETFAPAVSRSRAISICPWSDAMCKAV